MLREDGRFFSEFTQTFIIPANIGSLKFSVGRAEFGQNDHGPSDAFEVALLDADTRTPLLAPPTGLTHTDALLNLQHDGQLFYGSQVTVAGLTESGQFVPAADPFEVVIDFTGANLAGRSVTLYFDLLGFGDADSSVVIDNVRFDGFVEPDILVTPTSDLTTSEDGAVATLEVALTTRPTDNVTVTLFSTNRAEGVLSTPSLVFTPDAWDVPQIVTVTGIDDGVIDGDVGYRVVTAWATSLDRDYHGINPDDVLLVNMDNDPSTIPSLLGDFDQDGDIDADDIASLALGLVYPLDYEQQYSTPPNVNGDIDGDGDLDYDDIPGFVELLGRNPLAGSSATAARPAEDARSHDADSVHTTVDGWVTVRQVTTDIILREESFPLASSFWKADAAESDLDVATGQVSRRERPSGKERVPWTRSERRARADTPISTENNLAVVWSEKWDWLERSDRGGS